MEITEVRIKLLPRTEGGDKLRGFCSITLDDEYVIRDLKIIEGARGVFVAMPSRKLSDRCPRCRQKNHLRAKYCNECGTQLRRPRLSRDDQGRARLYVDVAHPINSAARGKVHARIVEEYRRELERARQGDYVFASLDDDAFEDGFDEIDPSSRGGEERTDEADNVG